MWRLLLGTMGVKSLVQGLNTAATAGFEPRTVWSEVRRRNRLATAPPRLHVVDLHTFQRKIAGWTWELAFVFNFTSFQVFDVVWNYVCFGGRSLYVKGCTIDPSGTPAPRALQNYWCLFALFVSFPAWIFYWKKKKKANLELIFMYSRPVSSKTRKMAQAGKQSTLPQSRT